ncbi:hypothetical protein QR52_00510 [Bordetella pertussis]|nr:hypothetical protein UN82_00510 [Bordetella pertussis]ALX23495.1 hypothetical protein RD18_00515 [Bordetella pertussis]AMS49983.1 hypothetical protein RD08_00880 [Bordetella pertussis]AMS53519.1 hypothetical protein RD09_00510 [Bordetella pertussis]AMS57145.1 hypothetical protein RD11_00510 [Bordetella pertussis]
MRDIACSESTSGGTCASAGRRSVAAWRRSVVMAAMFCSVAVVASTFSLLSRRSSRADTCSTLCRISPPRCSKRWKKPGRSGMVAGMAALDASRRVEVPSSRSSILPSPVTPCTPSSAQVDSVIGVSGATPMLMRTWAGLSGLKPSDCTLPTGTPW